MAENKPSILVVDDELSIRESFSLILEKDFKVILAASGEAALKKVIDEKVDLAYLDIRMPGMNGMETLKRLKIIDDGLNVIMVTAVNDIQNASEAVKLGAKDYIVKPFDSDEILKISRTLTQRKVTYEEARTARARVSRSKTSALIGQSKAIKEAEKLIGSVAVKDIPVLISGDNGTEKELAAQYIHSLSKNASGPFKVYNIPVRYTDEKVSRELFGWEKGDFVSDFQKEEGALERAALGTLVLNNIELLSEGLQSSLIELLSKKEFSRVGSMSPLPLEARLIFTTSSDLKKVAKEGRFSKKLLAVIGNSSIELPALKDRPGDISALINHFTDKYSMAFGKEVTLSEGTVEIMNAYQWPGNIVEMESFIGQIVLRSPDGKEVTPSDLPIDILLRSGADTSEYVSFEGIKKMFEKEHIQKTMEIAKNDKVVASGMLGIGTKVLDSKLESLGL